MGILGTKNGKIFTIAQWYPRMCVYDDIKWMEYKSLSWSFGILFGIRCETKQRPIDRFQAGGPPRHPDPARLADAFRWALTRKVTKTATISLEGNSYTVDAPSSADASRCGSIRPISPASTCTSKDDPPVSRPRS